MIQSMERNVFIMMSTITNILTYQLVLCVTLAVMLVNIIQMAMNIVLNVIRVMNKVCFMDNRILGTNVYLLSKILMYLSHMHSKASPLQMFRMLIMTTRRSKLVPCTAELN